MIFDFIIWFFVFSFLLALILVLNYYIFLFRSRENVNRKEVFPIHKIVYNELGRLLMNKNAAPRLISFLLGILCVWMLTLLGGFLAPDLSIAADYAASQIPNYFFQSVIFVLILHLFWPALMETVPLQTRIMKDLGNLNFPFLFSLSLGLAAMNISLWGLYHELSFIYCIINASLCLGYGSYRLNLENVDKNYITENEGLAESNLSDELATPDNISDIAALDDSPKFDDINDLSDSSNLDKQEQKDSPFVTEDYAGSSSFSLDDLDLSDLDNIENPKQAEVASNPDKSDPLDI